MKDKLDYEELIDAFYENGLPATLGKDSRLYRALLYKGWKGKFKRSFQVTEIELMKMTGLPKNSLWRMRNHLVGGVEKGKIIPALEHRGFPLVLGLTGNSRVAPLYIMVYEHLFQEPNYGYIEKVVFDLRTALDGLLASDGEKSLGSNMEPKTTDLPENTEKDVLRFQTGTLRFQTGTILRSVVLKRSNNNNNSISNTMANGAQALKAVSDVVVVEASPERKDLAKRLLENFEILPGAINELMGKNIEYIIWLFNYLKKNNGGPNTKLGTGFIVGNARKENGDMWEKYQAELEKQRQNALNQEAARESEMEADLQRESEQETIADFKATLGEMNPDDAAQLREDAMQILIKEEDLPREFIAEASVHKKMRELYAENR